ncbi:energy-coupling factor transporter transmembrane protein EcfT [Synechococcus sp. PCC 7336]|uniref:energy-coupling factor transporter transmembrane component T family protein n=1 Tax=Synechococcus sp. PCC 7336 TaxID=195250 RepID=UPI00034A7517|nr:energy-coupling factor transporter transmembrane protein EcfT [Synechococcus sp. PCC 7336]
MVDLLRNVPLGTYLESPVTWLHRLDPRVKFVWLVSILLSPILADGWWRLAVVAFLVLLTWGSQLPWRVWRGQLGIALAIALFATLLTAFAPEALGVRSEPVRPAAEMAYGLLLPLAESAVTADPSDTAATAPAEIERLRVVDWEQLPQPTRYRYELLTIPPVLGRELRISRRSLAIAIRLATLIFTLLYSTSLFLLATAPEEITEAIAFFCAPLRPLKVPVAEIVLTLTLALRFLPLVLEEVQNIARAVRTRDIHWQGLGLKGGVKLALSLVERVLQNLLIRAEQTASAMQVRGYLGPELAVQWHVLKMQRFDWAILAGVPLFWACRLLLF